MRVSSADGLPVLTIVTPCRNGARFIGEMLQGLRQQNYPNIEHIVIDACSTDDTLVLLARHPEIVLIIEPDGGIYDALNKGIARATGDIIGFLNTDDIYADNVLVEVGAIFAVNPEIDVLVGHSVTFADGGAGARRVLNVRKHERNNGFWLPELTFGVPGFNGCFFRRRVFGGVGKFETRYLISGDREFLIRAALTGVRAVRLDTATIWYRSHPGSLSIDPDKSHLLDISREYVKMAAEFVRMCRSKPEARRIFLAWQAFESAKLFVRDLLAGRVAAALGTFIRLTASNPFWPLWLAVALELKCAVSRLDVRYGKSTQP